MFDTLWLYLMFNVHCRTLKKRQDVSSLCHQRQNPNHQKETSFYLQHSKVPTGWAFSWLQILDIIM